MTGTAFEAFRSPNFALLWSAQVISGFGDKITVFALAFVTWELTQSALSTTLAIVISTVPHAIFGFFGGAIADAVGHRRAMIACDLIRVIAIGVIPAVLVMGGPLWVAYVLVLVAAMCSAIFNPTRMAIIPDLVPPERLGASNSMVFASDRTVEIVGTLAAGILVALLRESAFYVDALTFAFSALLLGRIAIVERPTRAISWGGIWSDALDGVRLLRDHAVLRANTVFALLAQLSLPIVNGLTPVLIFREYGLGPEHFGLAEAAIAVGAVAAGILYPALLGGVRKGVSIVAGFALFGLVMVAIGVAPNFPVVVLLFGLVGVTNVVFLIPMMTLVQEQTPAAARARVFGARFALLSLTWLPVILISGLLAEVLTVQTIFLGAGVFTLGVALIGSLFRIVRDVA
ncbi:MAG TPA: MFS transporter [Thermoanaerobaculia bacterium]|nr:MFS transporter [Thermoanaerobaculia bacterium]